MILVLLSEDEYNMRAHSNNLKLLLLLSLLIFVLSLLIFTVAKAIFTKTELVTVLERIGI